MSTDEIMPMVDQPGRTLEDLVKHMDRYAEEAFFFVREGLSFAADQLHGEESEEHRILQHFLVQQNIDWNDLIAQYHNGQLSETVMEAIEAAGGCEKLNRHVSGRELCWSLRDYALKRWGLMARVVLEAWNVRTTTDFGRIVFGFIDFDMMRKQEDDSLADFEGVYTFDDAFNETFQNGRPDAESEAAGG